MRMRRIALVVAVVGAVGCQLQSTFSVTGPPLITANQTSLTLKVGDSSRVDIGATDVLGNVITPPPAASSLDTTVLAVTPADSVLPQHTSVYAKAVAFGWSGIRVILDTIVDTIPVQTYPAGVRIGALSDTMVAGDTARPYPVALDLLGDSIAAPADSFWWAGIPAAVLAVDSATGRTVAQAAGTAQLVLHVAGGATDTATVTIIP